MLRFKGRKRNRDGGKFSRLMAVASVSDASRSVGVFKSAKYFSFHFSFASIFPGLSAVIGQIGEQFGVVVLQGENRAAERLRRRCQTF